MTCRLDRNLKATLTVIPDVAQRRFGTQCREGYLAWLLGPGFPRHAEGMLSA
jgi:hypothetical protein